MAHLPQAPGPGPAGQRLVHGQLRDAGRHEAPVSTGRNMSPDALAGFGVVYFGNDWFAENRTSSHHVAARIARIAPLLYVDSPGMRRPDGSRRDLKRGLRKLLAAFRRPIHVEGNLWHCTVPQLPFRGIPGMNAFNRWFGQFAVRRAMRAIGLAECISWFVVPHPGFLEIGRAHVCTPVPNAPLVCRLLLET